jgi:hypothetical protein
MTQIGATRASRGQRTICLPITEDVYARIVNDSHEFRRTLGKQPPNSFVQCATGCGPAFPVVGPDLCHGR